MDVGGLTGHVLAVGCASNIGVVVDSRAAISASYYDGDIEVLSQEFKNVLAEGFQVGYLLLVGCVVDVVLACGTASGELGELEVL